MLWLDGVEQKYVEEVGAMNVMFKIDGKIVHRPRCTGSVLPGVTRRVRHRAAASDWGYEVARSTLAIAEHHRRPATTASWRRSSAPAPPPSSPPSSELGWKGDKVIISGGKIGALTQKLYDTLTGIQWGKLPDTKGWIVKVD